MDNVGASSSLNVQSMYDQGIKPEDSPAVVDRFLGLRTRAWLYILGAILAVWAIRSAR